MRQPSKLVIPVVGLLLITSTANAYSKPEVETESCKPVTITKTVTLYETLIHTVYVDKPVVETVTVSVDRPVYITRTVYETKTVQLATDTKKLHLAILTLRARYLLLAAKYKKLAKR